MDKENQPVVPTSCRNTLTPEQISRRTEQARQRRMSVTPENHQIALQKRRLRRTHLTADQREKEAASKRRRRILQAIGNTFDANRDRSSDLPETSTNLHSLGNMDIVCNSCSARHFQAEMTTRKTFSGCCSSGNVTLNDLRPYPEQMKSWLLYKTDDGKNFRENIRKYNSAVAFASFGYQPRNFEGGPPVFVVHGQVHHLTQNGLDGQKPLYSQLYFLDPEFAIDERMKNTNNKPCKKEIMQHISNMLLEINPYATAFKMMKQLLDETENNRSTILMWITRDRQQDPRRYNLPVANEVAAVFSTEDGEPPFKRDIAVHPLNSSELQRIKIISPNCDPMTYPILFPKGEPGWHPGMPKNHQRHSECNDNAFSLVSDAHPESDNDTVDSGDKKSRNISMREFYSYRLQTRLAFNPLLHAGKLTQQFVVDAFLKVEGQRLEWNKMNQKTLRVDLYMGLMDYVNTRAEQMELKAGRLIILPSSFNGGQRAYQQNYQDAMVMVAKFGRPDLFITFTCNPKWDEITNNLGVNETAIDRPDLVATVFYLKLKELKKDMLLRDVLGKVKSYISVIEFQKRGLPHCHMLFHLEEESKLREPEDVDRIVCAEIPDRSDTELFDVIKTCMIHGPCGDLNQNAPCMEEQGELKNCTKGFPKKFCSETNTNVNGYPLYRRRNDGKRIMVRNAEVDNRYIVPYNPYLSRKYNVHINVEICSSVKSVKYIFKYVYKGHDAAVVKVDKGSDTGTYNWDEVQHFLDTRYVSAPEAMWRLRAYEMCNRSHPIERLPVHLPEQQVVIFQEGEEEETLKQAEKRGTKLTKWFQLNRLDPSARKYLYSEVPHHYLWNKNAWKPRKRGGNKMLTRMYSVSPKDIERYCLRLMLMHIPGATSFENLRTVNGYTHESFKDAALAMNLLEDDKSWEKTLEEAVIFRMPRELRQLFAVILSHCDPVNPRGLYDKYRLSMMEDFLQNHSEYMAEQLTLKDINDSLSQFGKTCIDYGLPLPVDAYETEQVNVQETRNRADRLVSMMNTDQRKAFDIIMEAVRGSHRQKYFFLSGVGGSGKTFVYEALTLRILSDGGTLRSVAPTGLAATLLKGGKTVHSGFGIPIDLGKNTVSRFKQGSTEWKELSKTQLIIWDEISMSHADLLNAVDRSLRDLLNINEPFGGIVVVLGGDFRQQAPVVLHGNRVKIVESCVKSSPLWRNFKELKLTKNMRVREGESEFCEWLLEIGNGCSNNLPNDYVSLDNEMLTNDIVQSTFGENINTLTAEDVAKRAVLCPKNEDTFRVNEKILNKIDGELSTFYSIDSIAECENEEERSQYPLEFLNSLTPMGMPLHKLNIKKGCCIMLLRNINPKRGLCNGTRVIVEKIGTNILECRVFSGEFQGSRVFVPKINLDVKNSDLPFQLQRKQFPVRLAYSMTITKSQGQTFDNIGVLLPEPVFTHGQLYTAFSRVRSKHGLKVQIVRSERQGNVFDNDESVYTPNVVFREILG